ncbi:MAG: hypothetical protein K0S61_4396, partial [Anaerocolumna sp.]|nr:hypothetical protein [Anaerocolumna sp.]
MYKVVFKTDIQCFNTLIINEIFSIVFILYPLIVSKMCLF